MTDNFEFRSIHPDEVEQAIAIEQICFPPNEACSPKAMTERIAKVPQLFLVAIDKSTGKLAGFLNGVATDEEKFRDEFFTDIDLTCCRSTVDRALPESSCTATVSVKRQTDEKSCF